MSGITDKQARQRFYLAKAMEAEEQAAKTMDVFIRTGWLTLADDYREMARFT